MDIAEPRARRATVSFQRKDFTKSSRFHVGEYGQEFPFDGRGELRSLLLIAEDDTFTVEVYTDDQPVIADTLQNLISFASELNDVSAFKRGDNRFVFAIRKEHFEQSVDAVVAPTEATTFTRQRAKVVFFDD